MIYLKNYNKLKQIPNFPDYYINKNGIIWSNKFNKWRLLKYYKHKDGYFYVSLYKNNIVYKRSVHTLVLETFVGPCPEGMQACHYPDHNRTNNDLNNLRWDTPSNNQQDRILHGTYQYGEKHPNNRLSEEDIFIIKQLYSKKQLNQHQIAKKFNISQGYVSNIINNKRWKHLEEERCQRL